MQIKTISKSSYKERQEVILVFGETGVGKSYACLEYLKGKELVVINLENRLHHLTFWFEDIPVLDVFNFDDFNMLLESPQLIKGKNVIIDSISAFYDLLIANYSDSKFDNDLTYNSWGKISRRLNDLIGFCKREGGKDVIMTAREKVEKKNSSIVGYRADVKQEIPYNFINTIVRGYYDKNRTRTFEVCKDVIVPVGTKMQSLVELNDCRATEYKKMKEVK